MSKPEWTQLSLPGPESFSVSDRSTLRPRGCMCWMSKISWYTLAHVQLVSSYIWDCLHHLHWFRSDNGCPRGSLLQSDLYTWCWQRPGVHKRHCQGRPHPLWWCCCHWTLLKVEKLYRENFYFNVIVGLLHAVLFVSNWLHPVQAISVPNVFFWCAAGTVATGDN